MSSGPVPNVNQAAGQLLAYCRARNWAGHDPYDALNSELLKSVPSLDSRWSRLVLTQLLKRSPVSLRPLLRVPPTQNPKGLALFLSALVRSPELAGGEQPVLAQSLVDRIAELRSPGEKHWCWGYSFPWQTRTIIVPRGTANLVCTTFVADALLDWHEARGDAGSLEMAVSAANHILENLYWTKDSTEAGLAYPLPTVRNHIHNANFLGAALFGRVSQLTGDARFREPALRIARYSASQQKEDGSWTYGDGTKQQWIDNFHTGYNLCGLRQLSRSLETDEFEQAIRKGFDFYQTHFIREDGAARYFHNDTYPIDIHCVSQTIITLVRFQDLDPDNLRLAQRVYEWAMRNMWDERGFFYYRILRSLKIRTSYMRWSQAWMMVALSELQQALGNGARRHAH